MDASPPPYDWSPVAAMALFGAALAALPLLGVLVRHRGAAPGRRLHALTLVTLFLTFDLVLFGAFTRLSDSGLGCPDWPGCYGNASPFGARHEISAAQSAMPTGPVTHGKAWVEMVHRYLATAVGVLIIVLAAAHWRARWRGRAASPGWATLTLVWVCVQGAFGALTVTMKLYPAIVTLHLVLGLGLLALLTVLAVRDEGAATQPLVLPRGVRAAAWAVAALTLAQVALGGWVSTNYAVLACSDFPTCQGQWWPPMDFGQAFVWRRELGQTAAGGYLPFEALTAIHMAHRLMAALVLGALLWLAWRLRAFGGATARPIAHGLAALAAWQLATGLSNVVLGWPLLAALGHTGGAAALVSLLALLLARAQAVRHAAAARPRAAEGGFVESPAR